MEYIHDIVNIPGLALSVCGEGIRAGTSAATFYSTDNNVSTVVAQCGLNELSSARVFINGVELFTRAAVYPNVPANIGVWSGNYYPGCAPLQGPGVVPIPYAGTLHSMSFCKHLPAYFNGRVMSLGDHVPLFRNGITEILLIS